MGESCNRLGSADRPPPTDAVAIGSIRVAVVGVVREGVGVEVGVVGV